MSLTTHPMNGPPGAPASGVCCRCGYSLVGLKMGTDCPECGEAPPTAQIRWLRRLFDGTTLRRIEWAALFIVLAFAAGMMLLATLALNVAHRVTFPTPAGQAGVLVCWTAWILAWWRVFRAWQRVDDGRNIRVELIGRALLVCQAFEVVIGATLMVVSSGRHGILGSVDGSVVWMSIVMCSASIIATFAVGSTWLKALADRCGAANLSADADRVTQLALVWIGLIVIMVLAAIARSGATGLLLGGVVASGAATWMVWNHFVLKVRSAVKGERVHARTAAEEASADAA